MKRVLFIVTLTLCCGFVFSQEGKEWKTKGFEAQIKLCVDEGVDYQKNTSCSADFVAAYRFNELFRLGAGIGIEYDKLIFEDAKYIYRYYDAYYEGAISIPIFVNLKIDFMRTKVSPYLSANCGYNFFIPFSKYAQDNKLGFFIHPAIGVDIHFSKCTLFCELGYKYQHRSFESGEDEYKGYHQISQSIGISF